MGLMNKAGVALIQKEAAISEKKKTGLLDRISNASLYDGLSLKFRDWLYAVKADRGGFLCSQANGPWHLLCATGFDLTTVNRFSPDDSAIDEILRSPDRWITYSTSALKRFLTFFSSSEADSLQAIHASYLGVFRDIRVCVIAVESNLSPYRTPIDSEALSESYGTFLKAEINASFSVLSLLFPGAITDRNSIDEKAKSQIGSGMKAALIAMSLVPLFGNPENIATDPQKAEIYRAIVSRIKKKAGPSNIVKVSEDYTVKVVLFSAQALDFGMYVRQLFNPLEKAFGIPRISRIAVQNKGYAESVQDIANFLRG